MALTLTIPAFAVTGNEPTAADANAVFIYNVEDDVTVKAYQIIDATYDEKGNGLTGYVVADGLSIVDLEDPTASEINAIATAIYDGTLTALETKTLTYGAAGTTVYVNTTTQSGSTTISYTLEAEAYYGSLEAGMWIILVWDSNATEYNPMIVSNWYADANDATSLTSGSVDADGYYLENIYDYTVDDDGDVEYSQNAEWNITSVYAKKSSIDVDKDIVNYTGAAEDEAELESSDGIAERGNLFSEIEDEEATETGDTTHGDDAGDSTTAADYDIGDTVQFEIKTTIPDYAETYFNVESGTATFMIIDDMELGLDAIKHNDITVTVGGTEYDATSKSGDNYVITLFGIYVDSDGNYVYGCTYTSGTWEHLNWTSSSISVGTYYTMDEDGMLTSTKITSTSISKYYTYAGQRIVINFTESFIEAHPNQSVVVEFSTTLNENAEIVYGEYASANINSTDIIYSNNPTTVFNTEKDGGGDTVYVYTFAITDEIAKVFNAEDDDDDEDGTADGSERDSDIGDTVEDLDGTATADGNTVTVTNPLAGAQFTIYYDQSCADGTEVENVWVYNVEYDEDTDTWTKLTDEGLVQSATCTTADDGFIQFYGLSEGTYYITETESPSGYNINSTVYKVVIDAVYNEDADLTEEPTEGTLASWSVTVTPSSGTDTSGNYIFNDSDSRTNEYEVTYTTITNTYTGTGDDGDTGSTTITYYTLDTITVSASQEPTAILDSRLLQLPSTGGIGLYVVIGVSALVLILGAFFILRKKKDNKPDNAEA